MINYDINVRLNKDGIKQDIEDINKEIEKLQKTEIGIKTVVEQPKNVKPKKKISVNANFIDDKLIDEIKENLEKGYVDANQKLVSELDDIFDGKKLTQSKADKAMRVLQKAWVREKSDRHGKYDHLLEDTIERIEDLNDYYYKQDEETYKIIQEMVNSIKTINSKKSIKKGSSLDSFRNFDFSTVSEVKAISKSKLKEFKKAIASAKDISDEDIDLITPEFKTAANDFKTSISGFKNKTKAFTNYFNTMSELLDEFGSTNITEVGFNGREITRGTNRNVTISNARKGIDFHTHPWKGFDNLAPSKQDIDHYMGFISDDIRKYNKAFLKEAYIGQKDRLLKFDFSNINWNKISPEKLQSELVEELAKAYEKNHGIVSRNARGEVEDWTVLKEYATKTAEDAQNALNKVLSKYGGEARTATRDNFGNFIDDKTGQIWKANEEINEAIRDSSIKNLDSSEVMSKAATVISDAADKIYDAAEKLSGKNNTSTVRDVNYDDYGEENNYDNNNQGYIEALYLRDNYNKEIEGLKNKLHETWAEFTSISSDIGKVSKQWYKETDEKAQNNILKENSELLGIPQDELMKLIERYNILYNRIKSYDYELANAINVKKDTTINGLNYTDLFDYNEVIERINVLSGMLREASSDQYNELHDQMVSLISLKKILEAESLEKQLDIKSIQEEYDSIKYKRDKEGVENERRNELLQSRKDALSSILNLVKDKDKHAYMFLAFNGPESYKNFDESNKEKYKNSLVTNAEEDPANVVEKMIEAFNTTFFKEINNKVKGAKKIVKPIEDKSVTESNEESQDKVVEAVNKVNETVKEETEKSIESERASTEKVVDQKVSDDTSNGKVFQDLAETKEATVEAKEETKVNTSQLEENTKAVENLSEKVVQTIEQPKPVQTEPVQSEIKTQEDNSKSLEKNTKAVQKNTKSNTDTKNNLNNKVFYPAAPGAQYRGTRIIKPEDEHTIKGHGPFISNEKAIAKALQSVVGEIPNDKLRELRDKYYNTSDEKERKELIKKYTHDYLYDGEIRKLMSNRSSIREEFKSMWAEAQASGEGEPALYDDFQKANAEFKEVTNTLRSVVNTARDNLERLVTRNANEENLERVLTKIDSAIVQIENEYKRRGKNPEVNEQLKELRERKSWIEQAISGADVKTPLQLEYEKALEEDQKKLDELEKKRSSKTYLRGLKGLEREEQRKADDEALIELRNSVNTYTKGIEEQKKLVADFIQSAAKSEVHQTNDFSTNALDKINHSIVRTAEQDIEYLLSQGIYAAKPFSEKDNAQQMFEYLQGEIPRIRELFKIAGKSPADSPVWMNDILGTLNTLQKFFDKVNLNKEEQHTIDTILKNKGDARRERELQGIQEEYTKTSKYTNTKYYKDTFKRNTEELADLQRRIDAVNADMNLIRDKEKEALATISNYDARISELNKEKSLEKNEKRLAEIDKELLEIYEKRNGKNGQEPLREKYRIQITEKEEEYNKLLKDRNKLEKRTYKTQNRLKYLKDRIDILNAPRKITDDRTSYYNWSVWGERSKAQNDRILAIEKELEALYNEKNRNEPLIEQLERRKNSLLLFKNTVFTDEFDPEKAAKMLKDNFDITLNNVGDIHEMFDKISEEYDAKFEEWEQVEAKARSFLPDEYKTPQSFAQRHDVLRAFFGVDNEDGRKYLNSIILNSGKDTSELSDKEKRSLLLNALAAPLDRIRPGMSEKEKYDMLLHERDYLGVHRQFRNFKKDKNAFQSINQHNPANLIPLEETTNAQDYYATLSRKMMSLIERLLDDAAERHNIQREYVSEVDKKGNPTGMYEAYENGVKVGVVSYDDIVSRYKKPEESIDPVSAKELEVVDNEVKLNEEHQKQLKEINEATEEEKKKIYDQIDSIDKQIAEQEELLKNGGLESLANVNESRALNTMDSSAGIDVRKNESNYNELNNSMKSLLSYIGIFSEDVDKISAEEGYWKLFDFINMDDDSRKKILLENSKEEKITLATGNEKKLEKVINETNRAVIKQAREVMAEYENVAAANNVYSNLQEKAAKAELQIIENNKRIEKISDDLYESIPKKERTKFGNKEEFAKKLSEARKRQGIDENYQDEYVSRIRTLKRKDKDPLLKELGELESSNQQLEEFIRKVKNQKIENIYDYTQSASRGRLTVEPDQSLTGLSGKEYKKALKKKDENEVKKLVLSSLQNTRSVLTGIDKEYQEEKSKTPEVIQEHIANLKAEREQLVATVDGGFVEINEKANEQIAKADAHLEAALEREAERKKKAAEESVKIAEEEAEEKKEVEEESKKETVRKKKIKIDEDQEASAEGGSSGSGNTTISGGQIIIQNPPYVEIDHTNETDVLETDSVVLNANTVTTNGEVVNNKGSDEDHNRRPISHEEAGAFIATLSNYIAANGDRDNKTSGLLKLRKRALAFDSKEENRANLKEWNDMHDTFENLKSLMRRNTTQDKLSDQMTKLVVKMIEKNVSGNKKGLSSNEKKLSTMLDNYFRAQYPEYNDTPEWNPDLEEYVFDENKYPDITSEDKEKLTKLWEEADRKRYEVQEEIWQQGYAIFAEQKIKELEEKTGRLKDIIQKNIDKGMPFTSEYLDSVNGTKDNPGTLSNSDEAISKLNSIISGEFTGNVAEKVLKEVNGTIDEIESQINKASDTNNHIKDVSTDDITKRIEDLKTKMYQALRDAAGTDAEGAVYKYVINDMEPHINDLEAFKGLSNRSPQDYQKYVDRGNEISNTLKYIKEVNDMYSDTLKLRRQIAEAKFDGDADQDYIIGLEKRLEKLKNSIRHMASTNGLDMNFVESLLGTHDEYEDYADQLSRNLGKMMKNIRDAMVRRRAQGFGYTEAFDEQVKSEDKIVKKLIHDLLTIADAGDQAGDILRQATNEVDKLSDIFKGTQSTYNYTVKGTQLSNLLARAREVKANTRGFGVSSEDKDTIARIVEELEQLQKLAPNAEDEVKGLDKIKFDNFAIQIDNIKQKYQELGKYGADMFTRIGKSLKAQMSAQIARYFSLYDIIRYVRTGVNTIKELDTAMVELRKVTDGTAKEYEEFGKTIRATAVEIASTNSNLIQSAADWARLGYSIKEATELAKDAQIFVNVGDGVDIKGATDMMITAMKAFNIEAEEALSIVDKYNEIGNNYALSATDIGDAMQRSASVLAASNTSFDESIALITAGNEIIQDPEKMGTALRTVALRIRGAKSELEEMGEETDYVVSSTSKLRDLIKGYTSIGGKYEGFDIMEDENTFKSLADIIKGIGEVYDEMSDIDRTAMLEKLAGKNRSNALAAMLQNYKQIDNVLKSIEESEGSALEENEHIVDSVQGRITKLQAAAENFWQTFLDTDTVKEAITTLTKFLEVLTDFIEKNGSETVIGGGLVSALLYTSYNKGYIGNLLELGHNAKIANSALDGLTVGTETYTQASRAAAIATAKYDAALSKTTTVLKGIASPMGVVTLAVTAAAIAVTHHIKKQKEEIETLRRSAEEFKKSSKTLDDYTDEIIKYQAIINDEKSKTEDVIKAKEGLDDINNQLMSSYENLKGRIDLANMSLEETRNLIESIKLEDIDKILNKANIEYNDIADRLSDGVDFKDFNGTLVSWFMQSSQKSKAEEFYNDKTETIKGSAFSSINISGSADERYKQLNDAATEQRKILENENATKDEITQAQLLLKAIEKAIAEYDKNFEKYSDLEFAIAYDRINKNYSNNIKKINAAYVAYIANKTDETKEALQSSLKDLWNDAADADKVAVEKYLDTLYGAFANIDNWGFSEALSQIYYNENNEAQGTIRQYLAKLGQSSSAKDSNGNYLWEQDWINAATALDSEYGFHGYALDEFRKLVKETGLDAEELAHILTDLGYTLNNDSTHLEQLIVNARNDALTKFGAGFADDFDKLNIATSGQLDIWNEIFDAANVGSEAIQMYALATSGLEKTMDASNVLKNMEEQYKPVFDAMAEAYKAIWTGKTYNGVDKVTSEQIESVRSQIEGLNGKLKEAGAEGFSDSDINDFILTLSTSDILNGEYATKAQEVQAAFDNIATVLVDSLNPALGQASGATAELMQKTLTELGVTNAEAVVFSRLGYNVETYTKAKEAAAGTDLDIDADISSLEAEDYALIVNSDALMQYYTARILAGNVNIETEDDVASLLNLCNSLGMATIGTMNLADAQAKLAKIMTLRKQADTAGSFAVREALDKQADELAEELKNEFKDATVNWKVEPAKFDGNTNKSSSTSGSDSKQKFDWIERAIKKIQRAITNLGKVADATYKSWGERLDALIGKTEEFNDEIGQFGRGNIDLYNRPQLWQEENGERWVETVLSESFEEDGKFVLVPTIDWDELGNPYEMTSDEALDRYHNTGEYLGIFDTLEEADDYAERLHLQQEAIYADYDDFAVGKYKKLKAEIALQEQASQAYMQEANAIGLAAEYRNKVMNGMMDIETITDETLKEQISDFQEYYDKATDCEDAIEDLRGEIASIAQAKFDMITKQFEEMALAIDHAATRIGHIQSKMSSEGYFESSALIEQLLFGDKEKLSQLEDEARQLAASIDEAVANGDIEYGSEQWWGMYDSLQNVNDQIVEMKSSMADLNDQLRQMDWDRFDYVQDSIERLRTENDFLVDTLETENQLFEKVQLMNTDIMVSNGNWTDAATAIQGLRVNNLQILQKQNEEVADEIKKINADLVNDPNNKKLLERRNALIDQQQNIIKGITQEKQSIKSLIQEGYETFLNYLQKSIDKRKEALRAEKNLYDYQRTVSDQTKTITDYRKQLAALSGGTDSEENRARLQQLKDDLTKAEKDLQDTEYERWLTDQEEMMDSMYESFENLINEKLDDLEGLIERAIQQTKDNSDTIAKTIDKQADEFIYDLNNTSFGVNFDARISDAVTAVNAVENAINTMINAANVNAQNELAQLQALAQTIVTQAQVQAQQAAQVNANTNNNSGDGGSGSGINNDGGIQDDGGKGNIEKPNPDTSKATQTAVLDGLEEELATLKQAYSNSKYYYDQYAKIYDESKHKDGTPNERAYMDEIKKKYDTYKKSVDVYAQQIKDLEERIRIIKNGGKFAQGGTIGKAVKSTGEDGIILARTGEEVLSLERIKQMQGIFKMMQPLAALGTNKTISNIGGTTTVNGMNVSFELPNVTSYEDFVRQAKSDPTFEKLVQNITIGTALGKSKLSKYSL